VWDLSLDGPEFRMKFVYAKEKRKEEAGGMCQCTNTQNPVSFFQMGQAGSFYGALASEVTD